MAKDNQETSQVGVDNTAEIRIRYLQNIILEHYRYTELRRVR
jgi:hypothetical protein